MPNVSRKYVLNFLYQQTERRRYPCENLKGKEKNSVAYQDHSERGVGRTISYPEPLNDGSGYEIVGRSVLL